MLFLLVKVFVARLDFFFALGGGNYTSNADSNGYFGEGKQLLPAAPCADPA